MSIGIDYDYCDKVSSLEEFHVTLSVVLVVIQLVVLIGFIIECQLFIKQQKLQKQQIETSYFVLCIVAITMYLIALLMKLLQQIGCLSQNTISDNTRTIFERTFFCVYLIEPVPLLSLYVLRLKKTFNETVYRINNRTFIQFMFASLCYVICGLIAAILYFDSIQENNNNNNTNNNNNKNSRLIFIFAGIFGAVSGLSYFIVAIFALTMFVKTIFKVTSIVGNDINHNSNSNSNSTGSGQGQQQGGLMDVIIKYAIISSITMLSTIITGTYMLIYWYIGGFTLFIIGQHLIAIDCLINSILLTLQFKFNTKYYHALCNWLHFKCVQICEKRGLMASNMSSISNNDDNTSTEPSHQ